MQSRTPPSIPKFASFRPKPILNEDASKEKKKSETREKASSREKRHHTSDHSRRRSRTREERQRSSAPSVSKPTQTVQDPVADTFSSQLFVSDRRGDSDNVRYGSIHRYAIPRYHRAGMGGILGLDRTMRIDRDKTTDKGVIVRNTLWQATRRKGTFAKLRPSEELRIQPRDTESSDDLTKDYLRLSDRKKKPKGREGTDDESASERTDSSDNDHWRSIEGRAKLPRKSVGSSIDDQPTGNTGQDHLSTDVLSFLTTQESTLSRKLEKEPGDAQAWFDMIGHQDILQEHRQAGRRPTLAERQSHADIKLSLYEKALKNIKDPRSVEALLEGLLKEARQIWDQDRLRKKWDETLSKYPYSHNLWIQFLDFLQTTHLSFKFDDVKAAYTSCFDTFRHRDSLDGGAKHAAAYAYAILRFTLFLEEGGFSEQAVSIWQANLEWNFRRPNTETQQSDFPNGTTEAMKKSFEDYWDAEVPRIGEAGSVCWASHVLNQGQAAEPQGSQLLELSESSSTLENWGDKELEINVHAFPARTIDDSNNDDPYRIVFFSDIEPFLLNFSESDYRFLINALLIFCQLPTVPFDVGISSWWEDTFVRRGFIDYQKTERPNNSGSSQFASTVEEHGAPTGIERLRMTTPNHCICLDTLYADLGSWSSSFATWTMQKIDPSIQKLIDWIHRVLEALSGTGMAEIELLEYCIAVELHFFPGKVRKTTKALLKKQQSNLRLYNAYALVEYRLGKPDKAQDTLRKAIQMSSKNPDTALLLRTLVWETLEHETTEAAVSQLLAPFTSEQTQQSAPDIDGPTILFLQRSFISARDLALSCNRPIHALANIDLLILLSYLTHPSPLPAALSIFSSNITLLTTHFSPTSTPHQLLHQSLSRLLHYHATHARAFQPSLLRSTLAESIKLFPTNTLFLTLYAWNEARFRIDDRVRAVVRDILDPIYATKPSDVEKPSAATKKPTSALIPHLFALHTELVRSPALGSNAHTVRAAFERAVTDPQTVHSSLVWRMYFDYELYVAGEARRAKEVFYRAVAACPWVKELCLLAWKLPRTVMGVEELRGVYEVVSGREMRISVELEDI